MLFLIVKLDFVFEVGLVEELILIAANGCPDGVSRSTAIHIYIDDPVTPHTGFYGEQGKFKTSFGDTAFHTLDFF